MNTIFTHRSIRNFTNQKVEEEKLIRILEAGVRASTTGNMQVYSIVVTTDSECREALNACHFNQPATKAPVMMTFCADFNRFNKWCEQRKAAPGYDNFHGFVVAAIDALLASQNVSLEAENQGLGICYLGTTTYTADRIIDILKLPKGVVPITTVVMGYPSEMPELTDRLPLEAVVHREVYRDYTPEDIDRIYTERDTQPLTLKLLEENGKDTLAQVFTDNRYTKKDFVAISNLLLDVLKKQGFMNNIFSE
ncbi:nitroreductase family protein [uncultured Acetobacteroides sp.]|uniref:nitroreductase family protein n=1 Tax=uncultured Acetobacteroides sp. TaxID=1760811 RepID=UPI0029F57B3D|nr:nitroreductase family protein [uncultured Acetobacteroides sp.]